MTVRQMRKMLKGLDPEMEIQIPYGEGMLRPVCNADSHVAEVLIQAFDPDTGKIVDQEVIGQVLMLMPCLCNESSEDAIEELALSSLSNPNNEQ